MVVLVEHRGFDRRDFELGTLDQVQEQEKAKV